MAAPKHHPRWWSTARVLAMHRDHLAGMTMNEVARRHGVKNKASVSQAFRARGLKRIVWTRSYFPQTYRFKTIPQIRRIIATMTRMQVPAALKYDWRKKWPAKKRAWFLAEARRHLGIEPLPRPSRNVRRFDYSTPMAHRILARMNGGSNSREWTVRLKVCSRGVIYAGELWFWCAKRGYVQAGRRDGRSTLHRHLYQRHHGPVPEHGVVCFADGNPHNLLPENLVLSSKQQIARDTIYHVTTKASRRHTAALLNLEPKKKGKPDALAKIIGIN